MSITYLVTHSGGFHADDLLSSVVLARLYPQATLVRSRDRDWITPGPDRIVFDVGGEYDAKAGMFDHHQRPAPLRPDGQPFSAFGLIWHHHGQDYLRALAVPEQDIARVHSGIERDFVLPVDLMDNGALNPSVAGPLSKLTLPVLLETLKPDFDEDAAGADDRAFADAQQVARAFLEAAVRNMAAKFRAEALVLDAIAQAGAGRVLELPRGMPFRPAVEKAGADHLLFVVHPRGDEWALNTIRKGGDTFEARADLPAAWAGLTGEALVQASGVPGAKFCHNARFIAVAQTREAIMRMAELAVAEVDAQTVTQG